MGGDIELGKQEQHVENGTTTEGGSKDDDGGKKADGAEEGGIKGWWKKHSWQWRAWQICALSTIVINLLGVLMVKRKRRTIVLAAALVACVVSIIVFIFQFRLGDEEAMNAVQDELRDEVNRLSTENGKLTGSVDRLETETNRLKESEKRLEAITKDQGTNVSRFVELVNENKKTLVNLMSTVKRNTMQTLTTALMDSDRDESGTYDADEVRLVEIRMRGIKGLKVNGEKLREAMGVSNDPTKKMPSKKSAISLSQALHMLDNIDCPNTPEEDKIFSFDHSLLPSGTKGAGSGAGSRRNLLGFRGRKK